MEVAPKPTDNSKKRSARPPRSARVMIVEDRSPYAGADPPRSWKSHPRSTDNSKKRGALGLRAGGRRVAGGLEAAGLGAAWLRAVCHDNPARLFGL